MSVLIAASNPFRPVDWRWRRALAIYEGSGGRTTKRLDTPPGYKWILQVLRFLRERATCRPDCDEVELAGRPPPLFGADRLWSAPSARRHSVEAHILARETDWEI